MGASTLGDVSPSQYILRRTLRREFFSGWKFSFMNVHQMWTTHPAPLISAISLVSPGFR
jgi:hypothetical protein